MMKHILSFSLVIITWLLAACGAPAAAPAPESAGGVIGSPRPTLAATPQPADPAYQMYLDAIQAEGTLEAARAQMTATARVLAATATAQARAEAASATAYAQAAQATATERAWVSARETASAQGTATAQAAQATLQAGFAQGTATAQYQATQGAVTLQETQQALAYKATVDAASADALATAQAAQAQMVDLALERERMMNRVAAATPWAMGVLAFLLAAFLLYRWVRVEESRRRVIRNADNNPDWLLDGHTVIVPGRLIGAGATVEDGNIRAMPATPYQLQVTTQAQLIEALRSIPPEATRGTGVSRKDLIEQLLNGLNTTPPQIPAGQVVDIKVVDPQERPEIGTWIADVEGEFIRE